MCLFAARRALEPSKADETAGPSLLISGNVKQGNFFSASAGSSLGFLGAPHGHCELVAQVLSPHPSYKLLLLCSTVLLQNRSGLPLEVCFLDANLCPLLMPAAAAAAAPLSVLEEQVETSKGKAFDVASN